MAVEEKLFERLGELGIAWELHEHDAVFTVEASAHLHDEIPGAHTKNLFLKDNAGQFWLITAPHDARVDLKALPGVVGSKKLSFGKPEDMERLLGISPGSVTPLAVVNDKGGLVRVVLDAGLAGRKRVNVHPLRNTATIGLSGADLTAFLRGTGHDILVIEVPAQQ